MNDDTFAGQWKQMRGALRSWWGTLTDDDFEKIGGQKDKLIGVIQERYGYSREQARNEVERRFNEYDGAGEVALSGSCAAVEDLRPRHASLARVPQAWRARPQPSSQRSGNRGVVLKREKLRKYRRRFRPLWFASTRYRRY